MTEINYKVVLIGNSASGKTSFFRKISTGEFIEKNISSIGIDRKTLKFTININKNGIKEKQDFNVSLFDTAGQEKFRAITLNYFKGSDGIILIYDIVYRASFDSIETWVNSIKESISDESKYTIFLIGNKNDLTEDEVREREVTEEEAKKKCEEFNMIWGGEISIKYIEHSAIKALMEKFIIEIYNKKGGKEPEVKTHKKIGKYKKKTKKRCIF